MQNEDTMITLARSLSAVKYSDLPNDAVEATKKDILDTLAAALAGTTSDGIKVVRDLALGWGGVEESTIIGYGGKIPSINAAFVNATTAHALDYDDVHPWGVVHAGSSAIPATLAVAEMKGGVTGRDYILANALGIDLMSRLGMAPGIAPVSSGWHNSLVFGVLGSAAACGVVLGFDAEKMVNALGIAYSQSSGTLQCAPDGALVKRMHAGFAARGAVLSALLADKGYTGARNVLDGVYGLFRVYFDSYNRERLLADFGRKFEVSNISFKPYATCRAAHSSIDAALALGAEHNIDADEIEKIVVFHGKNTTICIEPLDLKKRPRLVVHTQFSIPYTVARAFIHRKVSISDFTVQAMVDETVLALAQKVEFRFTPELTVQRAYEPVIMEVHLTGNRLYSKRVDVALGDPANPMTWEDLADKFRDCASYATKLLNKSQVEKVISMIANLEKINDIRELGELLG